MTVVAPSGVIVSLCRYVFSTRRIVSVRMKDNRIKGLWFNVIAEPSWSDQVLTAGHIGSHNILQRKC